VTDPETRDGEDGELLRDVVNDAISRGVLDPDPIVPLNFRRVICLPDGSRVDVQIARLTKCGGCGRIHGRDRDGGGCRIRRTPGDQH
jgi:hypothetical protein